MKDLADQTLIEAYIKAKELSLDPEFISIIADEIEHRKLNLIDINAD
ncbi:sporulation histidine kinase inhibitor Sda [Aquibacillus halophilus]|uniref:Sporulation histidine kinase inhibitor Sda n=1 Tax=Aquibacillus halophilus TaxID=930132 RepID=A0A6A8D7H2_9BACI|nr:sporulation histidine kinase inhibitor Sda [Aquibacillus halophilus]MRH41534.1 sporulation histidine kinase inhibitor Sda [Aquibacillus halophilus]